MPAIRSIARLGIIASLHCAAAPAAMGNDEPAKPVYLWLEAEEAQHIDPAFVVANADQPTTPMGDRHADGWNGVERDQRVSGSAYLQRDQTVPQGPQSVAWSFEVPADGEYVFWVRFLNPPPCFASFNLWLDGPDAREAPIQFLNDIWSAWNWWGWGGRQNVGDLRRYRLAQGTHRFFIGDVTPGSCIDKVLVTNDPGFIPMGMGEARCIWDFEKIVVTGSHGMGSGFEQVLDAGAAGWIPSPPGAWMLHENAILGTRFWKGIAGDSSPTSAIVDTMKFETFSAEIQVALAGADSRAAATFEHRLNSQMRLVIEPGTLSLVRRQDSQDVVLGRSAVASIKPSAYSTLTIHRDRTHARVLAEGSEVMAVPLGYPREGGIGIAVDVGTADFEKAEFTAIAPGARIDFAAPDVDLLRDWRTITTDGAMAPLSGAGPFPPNTTIWWAVPPLPECSVVVAAHTTHVHPLTVLMGGNPAGQRLELDVAPADGSTTLALRRVEDDGTVIALGQQVMAGSVANIELQFVRGRLIAGADGLVAFDASVAGMPAPSVGFRLPSGDLPNATLKLADATTYIEGFPLEVFAGPNGLTGNGWRVESADWTVVAANSLGEAASSADGILVASAPGAIFAEEAVGGDFRVAFSMHLATTTRAALCLRLSSDREFQLRFADQRIEAGFLLGKEWNPTASASIPALDDGGSWHDVSVARNGGRLGVRLDGNDVLGCSLAGDRYELGFMNFSDVGMTAFDNILLQRSRGAAPSRATPTPKDEPLLRGLEDSLLEAQLGILH